MSNCTVTFQAKNALVSGVSSGDLIQLDITLTAFDLTTTTERKENITMSGRQTSTKFYQSDKYRLTCMDGGLVTFEDTTTTDLTTEYMEMFFRSVDNSEVFTITSLDDSDTIISVQLSGSWSRNRRSSAFVDQFEYSFTVRKEL